MSTSTDRATFRATLATLADKTKSKLPALNGRIEKACRLVLQGDVELHDDGTALVNSLSDPSRAYQCGNGACQCRDWGQAPEHLCCHRLAVGFQRKVEEQAQPVQDDNCNVETPPLGEAPASANVRVTIAGREVQLTLRGVSEDDVLTRLERVLARYPVSTPAANAEPDPEKRYCSRHGTEMQINHKDGRSWHSHRTVDGQWCKGK
jgi:hypothetical protein